jgi:hypothetical protein
MFNVGLPANGLILPDGNQSKPAFIFQLPDYFPYSVCPLRDTLPDQGIITVHFLTMFTGDDAQS